MDAQRAQQIINSPDTINVVHNGDRVWLESVIPGGSTAKVRNLHGSQAIKEVPLTELVES